MKKGICSLKRINSSYFIQMLKFLTFFREKAEHDENESEMTDEQSRYVWFMKIIFNCYLYK